MSSEQGRQITDALKTVQIEALPSAEFELREGSTIPQAITLRDCPEELGRIVQVLRNCQLTRVGNQFLLVDRDTRKILEVIRVAS